MNSKDVPNKVTGEGIHVGQRCRSAIIYLRVNIVSSYRPALAHIAYSCAKPAHIHTHQNPVFRSKALLRLEFQKHSLVSPSVRFHMLTAQSLSSSMSIIYVSYSLYIGILEYYLILLWLSISVCTFSLELLWESRQRLLILEDGGVFSCSTEIRGCGGGGGRTVSFLL